MLVADTLVFGNVAEPAMIRAIVDVARRNQSMDCRGYDDLGYRPDVPRFLVVHRAQCPPEGSNEPYFDAICCPALTDLEVNCQSGVAKRFVDRGDAPSGWANGRVSAPYGDALAYLNFYGWDLNDVNKDGEACEISGYFAQPGTPVTREDPLDMPAKIWLAQWFAWRADQYKIPWQDFPIIKAEGGRSYITWHKEWTIGTGKICPGKTVCDATPGIIEMARAIMRTAQEVDAPVSPPKPPTYTPADLPEWWNDALAQQSPSDANVDGVRWFVARRKFEAIRRANRYSEPDTTTGKSGPTVEVRQKVRVERMLKDESGKQWLVEQDGHYLPANAFSPSISIKPR